MQAMRDAIDSIRRRAAAMQAELAMAEQLDAALSVLAAADAAKEARDQALDQLAKAKGELATTLEGVSTAQADLDRIQSAATVAANLATQDADKAEKAFKTESAKREKELATAVEAVSKAKAEREQIAADSKRLKGEIADMEQAKTETTAEIADLSERLASVKAAIAALSVQ